MQVHFELENQPTNAPTGVPTEPIIAQKAIPTTNDTNGHKLTIDEPTSNPTNHLTNIPTVT